jgi:AraC-like DNA-binding protein
MSYSDFMRSAGSVRLVVDFGLERGLAPAKLLHGSGLVLAQLDDPTAELTAEQELKVTDNLLRLLKGEEHLGLKLGLRYHFSAYGFWGYGVISSATMKDALEMALRFLPLTYAFTMISLQEEDNLGVLRFMEPDLEPHLRRFFVTRDMAAAAVLLREIAGRDFTFSRLTFRGETGRPINTPFDFKGAFGSEPRYDAPSNCLGFSRDVLSLPLLQANPLTASMCEQMCNQIMERRRARLGSAMLVRQRLAMQSEQLLDVATMAKLANMSERSLKRRLMEDGTSFRKLSMEVRRQKAVELLQDARLTMMDIAEKLGFSDPSSFSQAFKRWHGVAPALYRRHLIEGNEVVREERSEHWIRPARRAPSGRGGS